MLAVQWSNGIEDAWSSVASFIPKLFGFLLVLVIGYFVVKAISKIADASLERVGFDKAVERGGIKQALSKSQYDASTIVSKIVFYALFLFVLQMAFGVFGTNPVSDMINGVVAYLPKVLAAILIVVIMSAVAAAAKVLISNMLGGLSYGNALANVAAGAITAVAVFMALSQLEIAPAIVNGLFYGLLALVVGSGIIAIGFGGVQPMQQVWQQSLDRINEEAPKMREAAQARKQEFEQLAESEDGSSVSGSGSADVTSSSRKTVQQRVARTSRSSR
jgi:hypothetical protein